MTKEIGVNKLRELDAEIVHHILARGKLWEKRKQMLSKMKHSEELDAYQVELKEWLGEMTTDSKGD